VRPASLRARLTLVLCLAGALSACVAREPDLAPVRLTFLQFNDHYILEPVDREGHKGGMARIATLVARTRAESPHTLLALAGDTISPSIMSTFLRGEQMIAAWNALGLDVATFGNHEFDFGPATLRERMRESRFVWVSSNVIDRATGQPFGGARATHVLERGGVAVGFFGLTLPDTAETSSPGPEVEFRDPLEAARAAVAALTQRGHPVVVAVTHQDMAADERMARTVPGIHLVLGGHEHDPLESVVGTTLITKAGSDGVFVVRIDLQATREGKVLARRHRFVPVTAELPPDPAMTALVARYQARLSQALDGRIGETRVPLDARNAALRTGETNVGNYVADVIRARLRADVAVMNGGGIRGNQVVPAGPLARRDVNALVPFLNVLVKLEVSGRVLLDVLERSVAAYPRESGGFLQVSGLAFTFDPTRPPGARVQRVLVDGRPLDPERRYTLATNSYLARGGDGYAMLATAKQLVGPEDGPGLAETLVEAIERAGAIAPVVEGRIVPVGP
jgi:2',3'-cyclic-nucleotide 2'-phosphodiesterase (5'-nucleotidase family)